MTPSEAAGRALYLIEHPNVHPSVWDLLDQATRDWWIDRARPIADAAAAEAWEEGRDAEFQRSVMKRQTDDNPYRKAAA